jgi:polyisoprenoid-binding protein YceI
MKFPSQLLALSVLTLGLVSAASAAVETYAIDPVHSSVGFTIRHVFSQLPGSFSQFTGVLTVDRDNVENSSAEAVIQVGSVTTANAQRDHHLKTPDFFDAAKFGTITFKSKSWKKTGEETYDVTGDLTIKDVTKEVVLKVTSLGFGPGMTGKPVSGWSATTTINRNDYGVVGPAMLGKAVGNEVTISISIEADLKS